LINNRGILCRLLHARGKTTNGDVSGADGRISDDRWTTYTASKELRITLQNNNVSGE
jgi:hypothetical protein